MRNSNWWVDFLAMFFFSFAFCMQAMFVLNQSQSIMQKWEKCDRIFCTSVQYGISANDSNSERWSQWWYHVVSLSHFQLDKWKYLRHADNQWTEKTVYNVHLKSERTV